jgi:hypothetical protein
MGTGWVICGRASKAGDRRSPQAREDQATGSRLKYGGNPDYLQARLRRDAPEVAEHFANRMLTSDLPSSAQVLALLASSNADDATVQQAAVCTALE